MPAAMPLPEGQYSSDRLGRDRVRLPRCPDGATAQAAHAPAATRTQLGLVVPALPLNARMSADRAGRHPS
jgi:hypothetical protein